MRQWCQAKNANEHLLPEYQLQLIICGSLLFFFFFLVHDPEMANDLFPGQ